MYFEDLHPVGARDQRRVLGPDLVLAGRSDFVVDALPLPRPAPPSARQIAGADVLQRVDRRHREVAALDRRTMALVAAFQIVRSSDHGASSETIRTERPGHVDVPRHRVEDEELGLGTEVRGVAQGQWT
mgnify:CR=1 FL=1